MNKLTNNNFISQAPNDLCLSMFGVQNTENASENELLNAINTACVVAQTSRDTFNSVISKLFSNHVCKSIISEDPHDYSLHKAFAPIVQYMRFLQGTFSEDIFTTSQVNIDHGQSFFRIFASLNRDAIPCLLRSNMAEFIPRFFFTAQLQHHLSPQRVATWLNLYKQKPFPIDYKSGIESLVQFISPDDNLKQLEFIPDPLIDRVTQEVRDIREGRIQDIETTTLYREYTTFIDNVLQPNKCIQICHAPNFLTNDPNFMRRIIGQDGYNFLMGSRRIQQSREFITQALLQCPRLIHNLPPEQRDNPDYILIALQGDDTLFQDVGEQFHQDVNMGEQFHQDFNGVLEAVQNPGHALQWVNEERTLRRI